MQVAHARAYAPQGSDIAPEILFLRIGGHACARRARGSALPGAMLKDAATMAFASAAHEALRALQASIKFKFKGPGLQ